MAIRPTWHAAGILSALGLALLAGCSGNTQQATAPAPNQLHASITTMAANPADYTKVVQQLYVAYFGRPADTGGLANFQSQLASLNGPTDIAQLSAAYNTNPAIKSLIDSFGASAESAALYGGNNTEFVTAIYRNVLNRAPDTEGLNFWAGAINSGDLTRANTSLAIMAGATKNTTAQGVIDGQIVNNRIAVATYFTNQVSVRKASEGYSGSAAAATGRSLLGSVTAATDVTAFQAIADALVTSNLTAASGVAGRQAEGVASPSSANLEVGATQQLTTSNYAVGGATLATGTTSWLSSNPAVASVSGSGLVTAVSMGSATITGTSSQNLRSQAQVTVKTSLASCKLPERSGHGSIGIGFPRMELRLRSIGDVRVKVLFVDFSDAPANRSPQSVLGLVSPYSETLYSTMSYGKNNTIFDPVYTWLRVSQPSTYYGTWPTFDAQKAYMDEAIALAGKNVDYSNVDALLVLANPDAKALTRGPAFTPHIPFFALNANGKVIANGATSGSDLLLSSRWYAHEIGHAMSLVDVYSFSSPTHYFVGNFSLMGNIFSGIGTEFFAWERWLLGWATDDQVICAPTGVTTAVLSPVERVGGTKMVVTPISETSAVVVEARAAEGYDALLTKSGPLVYLVDTSIMSGAGPIKVLPINNMDISKTSAVMTLGESLTYGKVTVNFSNSSAAGYSVIVTKTP